MLQEISRLEECLSNQEYSDVKIRHLEDVIKEKDAVIAQVIVF